ncbi:mCG147596 [Mus musculus]|nr:mCG147596 [Mus musculus]
MVEPLFPILQCGNYSYSVGLTLYRVIIGMTSDTRVSNVPSLETLLLGKMGILMLGLKACTTTAQLLPAF